jgi:protease-4
MSSVPPPDFGSAAPRQQPAPPQIIVQQAPPTALGRYGKFLLAALAIAVMTIIGQRASYHSYFSSPNQPQEKYHSLSEDAKKKIAIIRVEGTIFDADGFVKQQIDRVRDDEDVVAVVLRIDSPGGTVTASDYLYHHLRALREDRRDKDDRKLPNVPIVVSMGSICASGGYYLAMCVGDEPDVIYAEPSTWTGSIGVVIPHYDVSGLLASWHVEDDSIASHKYKLMGSFTRDLPPEEREEERKLLQTLVDQSFARFKDIVRAGRPKLKADDATLTKASTGQIFTAQQALELGLIDKQGFLDAAIERAAKLAKRDVKSVRCVQYETPPTLLSSLGADSAIKPAAGVDLPALARLATPRAYYLWEALPAILSQPR